MWFYKVVLGVLILWKAFVSLFEQYVPAHIKSSRKSYICMFTKEKTSSIF